MNDESGMCRQRANFLELNDPAGKVKPNRYRTPLEPWHFPAGAKGWRQRALYSK